MEPLFIGPNRIDPPVLLAPMAGYTDRAFRLSVRELGGVGLTCSEMLNPKSVLRGGGKKRTALLATDPADTPLAYQIYGSTPAPMAEAAQWLVSQGATIIDINMGCPKRKIATGGSGSGLLREPAFAVSVARAVVAAVSVPVTVKIRLGWDADSVVAPELARELEQVGVAALAVHGRTRGQGYSGEARWDEIARVVGAVERMPVIGNGDVVTAESALALFRQTGCAGIMIGRAALKHPWLFREIAAALRGDPPPPPPDRAERMRFLRSHFERHAALYGEQGGALLFRKWIPQYARGLAISRERMVQLLRIRAPDELRAALDALG